jgi:hypothetical protein
MPPLPVGIVLLPPVPAPMPPEPNGAIPPVPVASIPPVPSCPPVPVMPLMPSCESSSPDVLVHAAHNDNPAASTLAAPKLLDRLLMTDRPFASVVT